jgi:hypothetical protein
MSAKELSFEKKHPIVADDLKYDGKNLIIPSYWAESILDFVKDSELEYNDADYEDLKLFRNFLSDVVKYNNK